jgi:hypothetical protein
MSRIPGVTGQVVIDFSAVAQVIAVLRRAVLALQAKASLRWKILGGNLDRQFRDNSVRFIGVVFI